MIRENGLYVLMGSKPMSDFPINRGFPESEEEIKKVRESDLDLPKTYNDFRKNCLESLHLHHKKLWQSWLSNMNSTVGARYRFVARKTPFGAQSEDGLFINVPNTLFVLHKHYQDFAAITNLEFSPEEVLEEIGDSASIFWEKAFQSHYLMGLLFGYGEKNAYLCDWEIKAQVPLNKVPIRGQKDFETTAKIAVKKNIKISDITLPLFAVYSPDDPTVKGYKKERQLILKELKGKDFEKTVINLLRGESPTQ